MDLQSRDASINRDAINRRQLRRGRSRRASWQNLLAAMGFKSADGFSVGTDKPDYGPGELATIAAKGVRRGERVTFAIADDPIRPGDDSEPDVYQPFAVRDGSAADLDGVANGEVITTWRVPSDNNGSGSGIPDALNATLWLQAKGANGDAARNSFTDSADSADTPPSDPPPDNQPVAAPAPALITDQADYEPGETATITASGFAVGSAIEFAIADDPNQPGEDDEVDSYPPFAVTDGQDGDLDGVANGEVVTTWLMPADATAVLNLTATGAEGESASTTASIAAASLPATTSTPSPTVSTDKADYAPNETATISSSGFTPGSTVEYQVEIVSDPGADAVFGTSDDVVDTEATQLLAETPWLVTDGSEEDLDPAEGSVQTTWLVDPDALNTTLRLTATGFGADGVKTTLDDEVAITSFTDGQQTLWAWRNQPGPTQNEWDAGATIQKANSVYAEGEVIPFVWTIGAGSPAPQLQEGVTYTIQIDYAFRGGTTSPEKFFFDYLTSYDATESASSPFGSKPPGTGFSGGFQSIKAIPDDPNGDIVGEPGAGRVFSLFNIDPASLVFSGYATEPVNSNQEDRRLTFTFTPSDNEGPANEFLDVGIAWGAHLATQGQYGRNNGAASFPGASPQMVVDLNPAVSGDQSNLNINPDAIIPQGQITVIKDAVPNSSQDFGFTITGPDGANITPTFALDDDTDLTLSNQITFFGLLEGDYIITETSTSGWSLTGLVATENGAEDTTSADISAANLGARTVTITVANGEVWSTTFTNTPSVPADDPSLTIVKSLTNPDDAVVDTAGETIEYTIVVDNTGNVDLTNVVLDDVFAGGASGPSGDTGNDGILGVNEIWTYTADYVVTQADLNAGINLVNVAGVKTNQTARLTDDATSTVAQNPSLTIVKSLTNPDDAVVDTAGETIEYTIVVDNTGNVDLTNVVLDDVFAGGASGPSGDTGNDGILGVNEIWTYTADYVVTQADLNAGINLVNVAGVKTNQTARLTDDATSTVAQNPSLTIVKSLTNPDDAVVDTAGETIEYTIVVDNTGNVDLTNVVLDDVFAGGASGPSGDTGNDGILGVNEIWTYTADYVVTQADLNAGINLVNVAGVKTNQTARLTDDATSTVAQNPSLTIVKSLTNPDDAVVDTAGETIEYTIVVDNTGNVDLTNVVLDDVFAGGASGPSGDTGNDGILGVNEIWTYTADYVVTQADLNAGINLVNVAGVKTNQTARLTDDATSTVAQNPSLTIVKSLTNPDDAVVDTAGETIEYTIVVDNTGNVDLTNVVLDDVFAGGASGPSGDTGNDGILGVNEIWTYTADYVVTQADLNAGINLVNVAGVKTNQTARLTDDATSTVAQNPSLTIVKSLTNPDDAVVDTAGETIEYTIVVDNTGNVDLTNVVLDDVFAGGASGPSGDTGNDGILGVNEIWTYTADYVVTQADLNAGINLVNVAGVKTNQTARLTDDATSTVAQNPSLTIVKSLTNPDDAVVDTAGETIEYTIVVDNTGNVDLTNVVLDDVFAGGASGPSGDTGNDGILGVNEIWTYTADYVVTQADLNAGINLVNVAGVKTNQTARLTDDATSTVAQNPSLTIVKSLTNPDDAVVDTAGETIEYTIVVDNTGNVDLTNVVLDDVFAGGASGPSGDTGNDGILGVNEIWTYTADYVVTQADLNAGINLVNVAGVKTNQTARLTDDATSTVAQNPSLTIVKSLTNPDDAVVDTAGETIEYTIVVDNTGNVDLTNVVLDDVFAGGASGPSGDTGNDGILGVNEIWTYTADYVVTQADLNAGINLVNVAGVKTNQTARLTDDATSEVKTNDFAQIAPTGTTCDQYIQGTAQDFSAYYASQGGNIQYNTRKGLINSTNPGVFFYYTGLSGKIKGTAPITVKIDQENTGPDVVDVFNGASNPLNTEWNLNAIKNDVKVYRVVDANGNGKIDAGPDGGEVCQQVNSGIVVESLGGDDKGGLSVNFTPLAGSLYVIGVKYDTSTVIGLPQAGLPKVNYIFSTNVGADGTIEETDAKGITLAPKTQALTLDGPATTGGAALTKAQLAPVVGAAIDYWAAEGVKGAKLNKLRRSDVLIGDLGGISLGSTDGITVYVDDDAAGHGWSISRDGVKAGRVDLFSAVVHEFGHMLGYEHDDMGSTLGIGERHLPFEAGDDDKSQFPMAAGCRSFF